MTDVGQYKFAHKINYIITFDDGLESAYSYAFPLLVENGCKAIFFIITDYIGKPGFMSKAQVRELVASGMRVASHSKSHPNISELSPMRAKSEFIDSKNCLEDLIGSEVLDFSFPFGKFRDDQVTLARMCGYRSIYGSRHGLVGANQFVFPRNAINASMLESQLAGIIGLKVKTRLGWVLEDIAKTVLKKTLGDAAYRSLRDAALLSK
ncbi:polysaccharide deacetylase family protein [Alphaproteobacteria bacterium]|nr:polysaccharide deacetylase family protein [Alphaproteobacteria bacterium]